MIAFFRKLIYSVIYWFLLQYLVNIKKIEPSEWHRVLTEQGYSCIYEPLINGYRRKYYKYGHGSLTIRVQTPGKEKE